MKTVKRYFICIFLVLFIFLSNCLKELPNSVKIEDLQFEPVVKITSPSFGSGYLYGDTIQFAGFASDIEDDETSLIVEWLSNKDGLLCTAIPDSDGIFSFEMDSLSKNDHIITLIAYDSDGNAGKDSIMIYTDLPDSIDKSLFTFGGKYNGHWYYLSTQSLSWLSAKDTCEIQGGHLVTISNANENRFVQQILERHELHSVWIGLSKEQSEADWVWVTNEPVAYTNWYQGIQDYISWNFNFCYLKYYDGSWHVSSGDYSKIFMMEVEY